ncbi:MAG: GLPGLI family protein [Leadbetterella sp.]|nr:GLPGLI family protein [Leadbetterella sp.]
MLYALNINFLIKCIGGLFFFYLISAPREVFKGEKDNVLIVSYTLDIKKMKNSSKRSKEAVKLFISPKESVFIDNKLLLKNIALEKAISPQERASELSMIGLPWFKCTIVKNFEERNTTVIEEHLQKQYNAYRRASMNPQNWNIISNGDSIISGMQCFKAECQFGEREWIAWFTPEIPVSDGPYKFAGLPGLILRIVSKEGDYIFHISGLERQLPEKLLHIPPNYHLIDEERFKEIQQRIRDNPFEQMESNGGAIVGDIRISGKSMTKEELMLFIKKEQRDYNYIE